MGTEEARHSVSVAAAIVNDARQVLVIRRRDNGKWEPPGGILEVNETVHAGLVREVREETGLVVEPLALTGVYKNMTRAIVALIFRCQILEGMARTTSETVEIRWLKADQIRTHMDGAYACRLLDALNEGGKPAVRVHDGVNLIGASSTPLQSWSEARET